MSNPRPWSDEPTPRTDEKAAEWIVVEGTEDQIVLASFARSLEQRLRAAERLLGMSFGFLGTKTAKEVEAHLAAAREEDER